MQRKVFIHASVVSLELTWVGIRSLLFLKKVVNFGRNFSNFDKVLIINLGLACSNNGDQDDHMASNSWGSTASTTKDTYNNHISLLFLSQFNTDKGSTNQTLSYCSLIKNFIINFCLSDSVCIHTFIMCGVCADNSCVHLSLDSCALCGHDGDAWDSAQPWT